MGLPRGSVTESSLRRNPFHILGAASTDDQSRIAELAIERSRAIEPQLCARARVDLGDSRSRLSAELTWFPEVSATRAHATVQEADSRIWEISPDSPLSRANALAACIENAKAPESDIVRNLLELATASQEIDADSVMRHINQSRSLANIPPADDLPLLISELAARRRHYREVARRCLNRVSTKTLVQLVTELVAKSTNGAQERPSLLVEEIVDDYEVAARGFIEGESYNIKKLVALIRLRIARDDTDLGHLIRALKASIANWSCVTRPIQLVSRSKDSDHPASHRLANHIRSLAVELGGHHALSAAAGEIMDCLLSEFALVSEFFDGTPKKISTLAQVTNDKEEDSLQTDLDGGEFERSLLYSANIGSILRHRLEFSTVGLSWKGRGYKFDEINRLRWGYSGYSLGALITGPCYIICFQNSNSGTVIHLKNSDVYNEIIDRLWRTVAVRILFEYVERLKNGGRLVFPCVCVEDIAVTLFTGGKTSKAKRETRLTWDNVRLSSTDHCLEIGAKGENHPCATMSYTKTDNLRVLEHLIGLVLMSGKSAVSAILDC